MAILKQNQIKSFCGELFILTAETELVIFREDLRTVHIPKNDLATWPAENLAFGVKALIGLQDSEVEWLRGVIASHKPKPKI